MGGYFNNMTKDEVLAEMALIAEENGVKLTENAEKIASFRARSGLPLSKCVCSPDNPYRGCISSLCLKEIEEGNICHCRCFQKA